MLMLSSISDLSECIAIILALFLPVTCGLFMCFKSPFARDGRMQCVYCKERISVSATVCPYCRRKNKAYSTMAFKSRSMQFIIGFFIGGILDALLVVAVYKFLQMLGF